MPDLRKALRDFVATSNSGQYSDEKILMSKFPELKGYDIQVLRDFVATSNSGQYATEEELFAKFPEFNQGAPVKKKFALDSSSEVGSSVLQKSPEELKQGFQKAIAKKASVPTDMSGKPIFNPEAEKVAKPIVQKIQKENQQLASEKKKYEDIFDKQLNIKPTVEESKYLKDRLATVNTELINKEEEYVVPELEYQFGDLGFKFEESGAAGDYVKVTSPDGKKQIEISLDNFLDSKSKTQSDLLQKFIKDNAPAKGLFVLEKTMREQDKKFNSQKQVDDSIKVISDEVNNLNTKQKQFLAKKSQFEKQLKDLGANADPQAIAALEQQRIALNNEMKSILQEEEKIKQKGKKLDAAVGKYSISKAKQGTWLGGIRDSFFGGIGKMSSGFASIVTDITGEVAPMSFLMSGEDATKYAIEAAEKMGLKVPTDRSQESINKFKQSLTEDQLDEIESYVRDQSKKNVKKEMLPLIRIGAKEILGDPNTTQQWEDLKKQDFWGGAILGLSESLPAMVGGAGPVGWAQRTAQMYAQVSDGLAQEMEQDPDFKDISENEKLAITLPIGIVGAVLENVGLRNIKGSQGVINGIALKALGKAGKGTTAKTFRELVENEVDDMLSKGLLTITAAGAAEFETGAAQELSDTGFKALYNEIKGKEMFDTPDSTADLIENVVVSGAQEAVGGFVLGVPSAVSTAFTEKGFLKMDDISFETFANMANDDKMQSAFVTNLKEKITRGELTTAEAKDQLNNYRNSVGLFRQLPEGLNTRQQKEAMNLLKEKRDLENFVEGKDPALVVKAKNRINEINDSLTKLTETDAIQEQSTTEIPVQSETGVSETMEKGIPQSESEVITEQVTQEEVTAPQTIIEALKDPASVFIYDGKKGQLTTIGQMVVLETPTEIIDLVDMNELSDSTLDDFGIQKENELDFSLNEDNSVVINGKTYLNNYSNPEAAISQDKDGNYSVTLDTENGQKRTFRGQQADQIVYQMKLKNFEQNGTEQDIDTAIELADEAIRIEEEIGTPSVEREGKTVRKAKRKQRTLKTVKEPLTKAERLEKEKSKSAESIKLYDLLESEEYNPKVRSVAKGKPIPEVISEYNKAKETNSNPELVSSVDGLLAVEYEAPKGTQGMLPVGTEVEIDGKKGKITETVNFVGEQQYKISYSNKNQTTSEYITVKDFNKKGKSLNVPVEEEVVEATAPIVEEVTPIKTEKIDKEIARLEGDVEFYESKIQEIEEEIEIEKGNTKEGLVELKEKVKKELEEVKKDKSLSRDEKIDKVEEIKYQIENFKEEQESIIDSYKDDLKEAKSEYKKALKKVNNLYAQKRLGTTETKELLDLDTKDKDGLNRVLDFLDKIDDSLDMDANELNDVTRVITVNTAKLIVKTLKTLVNAGITLKEAIDKVAEIYSVKSSEIIDALDIISKINENKSEGISEMEAPGYNNLSKEIDNMISNDSTVNEVLDYVQSSDVYEYATDVQRELLVRDVRKRFGLRQKGAPTVGKLFGTIKDVKNITMREKDLLVKQIKDRAKGARESVQAWKEQSKQFAKELDELAKSGKITNTQVGVILKKFSNVNIFSEKSMNRFTDYMVKTFNDADYNEKLSKARKTLSSLKKLSKNQEKNGDLRALASEFIKIDPSFVENIDEYNDIASNLKTAVEGSKIRKANVKFADTVNAEDVISYVEKTLVDQESKIREEKIQEIQDLLGVDASEFDAKEIDAMLESENDSRPNDNEKIVRATIKKAFNIYSSVIKEMLSTGTDPFTDEEVTFDDKQRDIIERFMAIDPDKIENAKDALRAVDSLINFVQNKSTAGMLKTIAQYEGVEGGEQAVSEGLKAKRLRKYFSSGLGLVLGQEVTSLPVLFDKMFKGVTRALRVEELIGVSDLINNSSKAESETNRIVKNYVKEFYKRSANGESFNSLNNDIERGVFAHVFRNVIGNEETMKKVFDKRKQEVLDTIELLSNKGNESELETAKILQKVYDKILDGSENIQDVRGKVDVNNAKAVEHWVGQWSNKYEAMSDLALNFYNKVLGKDLNFTPDRIKKLQDKVEDVDLDDIQSQFFANTDDVLYDKKSGSLMDKQENRSIPKDMYVDFSFDKKNSNAMNDALTDLYTAFDVAKVGSFLKSKEFRKIFPTSKEANLIDKRIKKFVRLTRKKTPFSNEDISNFLRKADKIAKLGVTASLASPFQPFKQTVPVMFSTAMSAGSLGFGIAFNTNFNTWLDDLGFAISNRGVESQAQIDSFNKLIEKAADMPLDKALKFIDKTNDKALKALLVNFDVWIARASFKAYYEQSLKRQGLQSSFIDYSNHKVNKEAANYAQRMVDRQQNISNPSLAGDLFTSNSQTKKTFVKMLMPFSSFRMNQSARLGADLSTLEYWNTSTKEDKVIALRSLLGYTLESAAYRSLQIGFSLLTYAAAKAIMGGDDEEEDKKTTDNLIKGSAQSAFVDTFSPLPLADPFVQDAISYSVEEVEALMDKPEEERTKLFGSQEQSALKVLGTYGIPLQKAKDLYALGRLAYTGKYKDNYGKEKEITQDQADKLKTLIGPLFAASVIGVASPDMTQIVNKSIKMSKKNSAPINKSILKERNPDKYEELFGEGSRNYEIQQIQKEREQEIKDRIKERMNR